MSEVRTNWPPIITGGQLPLRVVIRDALLTILMWATLLYGVVSNADVARQAAALVVGIQVEITDPVLIPFLGRLERRIWIIAILVAILGVSTLFSVRRREKALLLPQPTSLPDSTIAQNLGVSLSQLSELKNRRIVILELNDQRKIVRAISNL